jgi:hypothetical protein
MYRSLIDYTPEAETFEAEAFRDGSDLQSEADSPLLDDAEAMEQAVALLDVQSERELDLFLRDLITRTARSAHGVLDPRTGQAVGAILKGAVRRTLTAAALGPGDFARKGPAPEDAADAGRLFGLELEGLSPEDQEFEVAKSFIRFAVDTVRTATAARGAAPPAAAARAAAARAAGRYAPGLLRTTPPAPSGRWIRQGSNIVVVNS